MLRFAKVVYPYWRERRMERGGHPIIPVVNVRIFSRPPSTTYSRLFYSLMKQMPRTSPTYVSGDEKARLSAKRVRNRRPTPTR